MPRKKQIQRGSFAWHILQNQSLGPQALAIKIGKPAKAKSIAAVRSQLRKTGRLSPSPRKASLIDQKTGEPLRNIDKARKYILTNRSSPSTEIAEKFGLHPKTIQKIRKEFFPGKTVEVPKGSWIGSKSPINPETGEPIRLSDRIRRRIIQNPQMPSREIAKIEGTTKGAVNVRRAELNRILKAEGKGLPDRRKK